MSILDPDEAVAGCHGDVVAAAGMSRQICLLRLHYEAGVVVVLDFLLEVFQLLCEVVGLPLHLLRRKGHGRTGRTGGRNRRSLRHHGEARGSS